MLSYPKRIQRYRQSYTTDFVSGLQARDLVPFVPIRRKGGCNALKSMGLIDLKYSSIPTAPTKLLHFTVFVFAFDTNSLFDTY